MSGQKIKKCLGANLQALRFVRRMTQAQAAKKARIKRSTLAHWESGDGNPTFTDLVRFAASMNVSLDWLASPAGSSQILCEALGLQGRVE